MNKITILIGLICLFFSGISTAQEQDAELAIAGNAGGTMMSSSYMIDFTIGEVLTDALMSETVMLTQGFHQADTETVETDQGVVSGLEENEFLDEELDVYPNPFKTKLNINYSFQNSLEMDVTIWSLTGELLLSFSQNSAKGTQEVDLSGYPKGIYFIKFYNQEQQKLRTFKIIKA